MSGSSIFIQNIDMSELEARFSTEDTIHFFSSSKYSIDDLKPYLAMLPKKEADLILMYHILKKDQKEIAQILNLSQGGVSHRIARARERLKFLISIPKFTRAELLNDLKPVVKDQTDLSILWELYRTTCQSQVAEIVGMTQSRVRHRFMKCLKLLETQSKIKPEIEIYYRGFLQISKNFNILREITLPKWEHKNRDYKDLMVKKKS